MVSFSALTMAHRFVCRGLESQGARAGGRHCGTLAKFALMVGSLVVPSLFHCASSLFVWYSVPSDFGSR